MLDLVGEIPQYPLGFLQDGDERTGLAAILFNDGVYLLKLFLGKLFE
jgi:hypothetical protein